MSVAMKDEDIVKRLDALIMLAENLFILQALKSRVNGGQLRSFLRVDMNRVTAISRMLRASEK